MFQSDAAIGQAGQAAKQQCEPQLKMQKDRCHYAWRVEVRLDNYLNAEGIVQGGDNIGDALVHSMSIYGVRIDQIKSITRI